MQSDKLPVRQLRVSLFGKLSVCLGDRVVNSLHSTKAQELLCFLLLHRDRPHARETLAGMLWGDCPTVQSRKYLRQALWQLQFALTSSLMPAARRILVVEPEWVRLNERADLWLDIAVFERACSLAQPLRSGSTDLGITEALDAAVGLYRGDLLEGWYQDWCLYQRDRLQNMLLTLLDKLMNLCEARQAFETALTYGTRILLYDPAREPIHQRMMILRYLSGDRAGALRQYERCLAALKKELGVKPSKWTKTLYRQIRSDQLDPSHLPPAPLGGGSTPPLPQLVSHLRHLRLRLADLQRDVSAVEHVLELEVKRPPASERPSGTRLPTPRLAGGAVK